MKNAHNEQTLPSQYLIQLWLGLSILHYFSYTMFRLYLNVGRGLAPAVFYEERIFIMNLTIKQVSSLEKIRSVDDIPRSYLFKKTLLGGETFSYQIVFNFTNFDDKSEFDKHFESVIKENNNKNFVNVISKFVPLSFAQTLLMLAKTDKDIKCHQVSKEIRAKIVNILFGKGSDRTFC